MEKKKHNRNRHAGHQFERTIAERLRKLGFEHVVTSRSESVSRDGQGIDLMNRDEGTVGRLPYNIQCKNTISRVEYNKLLGSIPACPGIVNVVFHKFTERKAAGGFHAKGHYAILDMEDFLKIMEQLLLNQKPQS